MPENILLKTVCISLAGHIGLFSFFSFSFGNRMPAADWAHVSFWGEILPLSDIRQPPAASGGPARRAQALSSELRPGMASGRQGLKQAVLEGIKPQQYLEFSAQKPAVEQRIYSGYLPPRKKEQTLYFHPILPQNFFLYFSDRQVAHVELMLAAPAAGRPMIKRKISSGNLEVDLLTMRYMSHYFFIRQGILGPAWQTIKIDLSARQQE